MPTKKEILAKAEFGSRIAEDEVDELQAYFVETEQWKKILAGEVDIVFGPKGSGKSAIYSLLVAQKEKLRLGQRTLFLAAENPRGTPAFRDLSAAGELTEDQLRGLWKLYFLSIAANYLRHHLTMSKAVNSSAQEVIDVLVENELLTPNVSLMSRLKSVVDYIRDILPSVEGSVMEPNSGLKLSGRIVFKEPTAKQRSLGYRTLDDLLQKLDSAFDEVRISAWLVLDRLDVAFVDSGDLEGQALRALFRTYLDMQALGRIKVKIFIRDDIWRRITDGGFREASHVVRYINLTWDRSSLLNLLVRRLIANPPICDHCGVHHDEALADSGLQEKVFQMIFPEQVDVGPSKPKTLEWMLSRVADGSKRTAPRELIHLMLSIRDEQMRIYGLGSSEPSGTALFDRNAIRASLPPVSKARFDQTLCAENAALKPYLIKLERAKTEHTATTLGKIWKIPSDQAANLAERLVEAGFFERRGHRDSPSFWVPFLYRDALDLVQGAA